MALKLSHSEFRSETKSAIQDLLGKGHTAIKYCLWTEYLEQKVLHKKIKYLQFFKQMPFFP